MSSPNKSGQRENMAKYQAQRILYDSGGVNDEREWEGLSKKDKKKIRKDVCFGTVDCSKFLTILFP